MADTLGVADPLSACFTQDVQDCEVFPASLEASTEGSAIGQENTSAPKVMDSIAEGGCSLLELPTEVFIRLAKDLPMQALVSLGSSCSRLHSLTLLDELWAPFAGLLLSSLSAHAFHILTATFLKLRPRTPPFSQAS